MAPSATPPSQNTFALLDAADESHALAAGTVAAGTVFDTAEDNDVNHMEGTAREDGDSQPLLDLDAILALDAITDPIIDTLNAHDRVLTSTIAGVAKANRALNLAITGVATTLDDDDDDVTDDTPTMVLLMPTVPHGDVTEAPTMATMMLVLQRMQSQNQAILNRLVAMDDTSKKRHVRLRVAITSKADSTEIAHLDHQLEVMEHTIRDNIDNTIGGQLTSATKTIVDIKANLSHVTITHIAQLERLENMLTSQHACLDSHSKTYDNKFVALEQRLSTPTKTPRPQLWLIPPSEGATAHQLGVIECSYFRDTDFPQLHFSKKFRIGDFNLMLQFFGEWSKDERISTKMSSLSMDNVPSYVSSYFTKWSANIIEYVSTIGNQICLSDLTIQHLASFYGHRGGKGNLGKKKTEEQRANIHAGNLSAARVQSKDDAWLANLSKVKKFIADKGRTPRQNLVMPVKKNWQIGLC